MRSATASFQLHARNCNEDKLVEFAAAEGEVTFQLRGNNYSLPFVCWWRISVPETFYMFVRVETVDDPCHNEYLLKASYVLPLEANVLDTVTCYQLRAFPATYIPYSNVIYFTISFQMVPNSGTAFRISFVATKEHLAKELHVVKTSPTQGYVTPPGYDGRSGYAGLMDAGAMYTVEVPEKHTVMISFERFDFYSIPTIYEEIAHECIQDYLMLFSSDDTGADVLVWTKCSVKYVPPEVFNRSISLRFITNSRGYRTGFKIRFSLHRAPHEPRLVSPLRFDCSGTNYDSFKQHVHCNTVQECRGREDEGGHCPFSSPLCNGSTAVNDKCYSTYYHARGLTWEAAVDECSTRGAQLATMKTPGELEALGMHVNFAGQPDVAFVGLTNHNEGTPHYYRNMSRWIDNVINYSIRGKEATMPLSVGGKACSAYNRFNDFDTKLSFSFCTGIYLNNYVCEKPAHRTNDESGLDRTSLFPAEQPKNKLAMPFIRCPSRHVTHDFLACHGQSRCRTDPSKSRCFFSSSAITSEELTSFTLKFPCVTVKERIPYTFVCDYRKDCVDASDEVFCVHANPNCTGFTCENGQCIPEAQVCDTFTDCEDGTDETICQTRFHRYFPSRNEVLPPAIINFDGSGLVTQVAMNESEPCPDTHFRCPGKLNYCMPVYVLCNGMYDCIGREDEAGCDIESVTCPGFYRCWDSAVCVHPDHICDGWPQCPRHDDELMCNIICPHQCHCHGLAFLCLQPFPARDFPDLRYLDASGSGMEVEDLAENRYLIFIVLASCRLTNVSAVQLPNVRTLDLSENLLRVISMDVFLLMRNLKVLRLAGNPLVTLVSGTSSAPAVEVESIDISRTQLEIFDSAALEKVYAVKESEKYFGQGISILFAADPLRPQRESPDRLPKRCLQRAHRTSSYSYE